MNLKFLSSRAKLGRVLANTFWLTYQTGPQRKTVLAVAWVLKIFYAFLDHRAESMPDVLSASDLNADILKEYAVWLVACRRLQRKNRRHGVFDLRLFPAESKPGLCIGIPFSLSGSETSV